MKICEVSMYTEAFGKEFKTIKSQPHLTFFILGQLSLSLNNLTSSWRNCSDFSDDNSLESYLFLFWGVAFIVFHENIPNWPENDDVYIAWLCMHSGPEGNGQNSLEMCRLWVQKPGSQGSNVTIYCHHASLMTCCYYVYRCFACICVSV